MTLGAISLIRKLRDFGDQNKVLKTGGANGVDRQGEFLPSRRIRTMDRRMDASSREP